ncbi:hypothetical protein ANTQUA_LOCUS395 [Anthophora quadrimaculata]
MDSLEHRYYKFIKMVLLINGLWPYENSRFMYVKRFIAHAVSISCIVLLINDILVLRGSLQLLFLEMAVIIICFVYLFLANYMGQKIINSSSKVFDEVYNSEWYTAPVSAQKKLLYIMQHSIQSYSFSIGGLFVPCYQGFTTLVKTSVSYFMVAYSMQ